jgi:hypothetical protein
MPVITLTTDIGQQDYLVGAIKGQLLSANPVLHIHDITHYLSQSNYPQAAYVCSNAFKYFPDNTFHIIILNLFETNAQQLLIAKYKGQYIACPDNGILTMIAGEKPKEIVSINISQQNTLLQYTQSIAIAIGKLFSGSAFAEIGTLTTTINEKYPLRAMIGNNWMEGQILFIDQFENVVINITKEEFEEQRQNRNFKIVFKRDEVIETISNNYAAVFEGEKLAWFNSAGYLEIAMNKGNIAGLFGLQGYNEKMQQQNASNQNKWFYQTVRIFFE